MALAQGQVQIRDLVMGPGTPYRLLEFNPWTRTVRADQGDERAWNDGRWSGAEWTDQAVVPMNIVVRGHKSAGWLAAHQELLAAFAPSHDDIEMRFAVGAAADEYVMFGRPRMVDPDVTTISSGLAFTKAAFVALDPTIYSGVEHTETLRLPSTVGGLTVPVTVPLTVPAMVTAGRKMITNAGRKTTALRLRIDGPVPGPRVSLLTDDGPAVLRLGLTLDVGQWLDIDTGKRTVYLNGTASRRGQATADGGRWPVLPSGAHELAFDAAAYDPAALLTATWRDASH